MGPLPLRRQEIFNRRHMRSQCRVHRHGATFLTVSRSLSPSLSDISAGFCRSTYCDGGETKGPSSRDAEKKEIFPRRSAHFSPSGGSRRGGPIAIIAWRIASHPERKRGRGWFSCLCRLLGKKGAAVSVSVCDEVSFGVISGYEPRKLSPLFYIAGGLTSLPFR